MASNGRRLVRLVLVDPDERVRDEDAVVWESPILATHAKPQELWMEWSQEVMPALEEHNARRQEMVDREATARLGHKVMLEPVTLREMQSFCLELG